MKKKFVIINLSMMVAVLFAILFQSLHSYEHFLNHENNFVQLGSQNQDVHLNDHDLQQCFVCEFTFSNFDRTVVNSLQFKTYFEVIAYSFFYKQTPSFFSGSQSFVRGPPIVA